MNEKMLTDEQMKTRLNKILNSPITDPLDIVVNMTAAVFLSAWNIKKQNPEVYTQAKNDLVNTVLVSVEKQISIFSSAFQIPYEKKTAMVRKHIEQLVSEFEAMDRIDRMDGDH